MNQEVGPVHSLSNKLFWNLRKVNQLPIPVNFLADYLSCMDLIILANLMLLCG